MDVMASSTTLQNFWSYHLTAPCNLLNSQFHQSHEGPQASPLNLPTPITVYVLVQVTASAFWADVVYDAHEPIGCGHGRDSNAATNACTGHHHILHASMQYCHFSNAHQKGSCTEGLS